MDDKIISRLREIRELILRDESSDEKPSRTGPNLRFLRRQLYLLILLTSPIWISFLAINSPQSVLLATCAGAAAFGILVSVRRLNCRDDPRRQKRPPDAP